MLSLWALFLLSGMVISWALEIDSRMALNGNASRVKPAISCSGSEIALHPGVKPGSPICAAAPVARKLTKRASRAKVAG